MTAELKLFFSDGTEKIIKLSKAIELNTTNDMKQSICFLRGINRNTCQEEWFMTYSPSIKDGKMFADKIMEVTKNVS